MYKEKSSQIVYLDVLRFLATIAVVVLHVCGKGIYLNLFTYDWYVSVAGDSIVRWAVPIFVMISGALLLRPEKEVTINNIVKKRIPRLLLAYVFWSLAYTFLSEMMATIVKGTQFNLTFSDFRPHFHLWFLPMLMSVYVFIPLVRKIVVDKSVVKYTLIVWFLYCVVCQLGSVGNVSPRVIDWVGIKLSSVFGYIGYFILGYVLSRTTLSKKQRNVVYLIGVIGVVGIIMGTCVHTKYLDSFSEAFYNNKSPLVVWVSMAVFVAVKENSSKYGRKTEKMLASVRNDLFGVYLVHAFWLMVINVPKYRDICDHIISLPLIAIVVFVLSLLTAKVIRLIPYFRKVVE